MREAVCPNCEGNVQVWNPNCCHVDGCHECGRANGLPVDRWPTPTEWLAWVDSLDRTERLETAAWVIEAAKAQERCLTMDHEGAVEEARYLRQRVADLTLALHDTPTRRGGGMRANDNDVV